MGTNLQWFRDEIRKAYGGRASKVLDPFAGGGAIPLEAMRLGCEVTAMDINPGGMVHPEVHARIPPETGGTDAAAARVRGSRPRRSWHPS